MGSRHNRRRTRSRPRNRNRALHNQTLSFDSIATSPPVPQPLSTHSSASGSCWNQSLLWNDGFWLQHQRNQAGTPFSERSIASPPPKHARSAKRTHNTHLQMFGGEPEDGMELCDSMVQVMLDLFDGSIDFKNDFDEVYGSKK